MTDITMEGNHEDIQGKLATGLFAKIIVPIVVAAIGAGIVLWSDQRVTANAFAEHKTIEEARLSELRSDIRLLRDEIRGDLASIRLAVEKSK